MAQPVLVVPLEAVACPVCGTCLLVANLSDPPQVVEIPEPAIVAPHHLTNRQREVLLALADGGSNKSVAKLLGVSVKTVESHRGQIMDRLDLHSIAELTRYAVKHEGVIP